MNLRPPFKLKMHSLAFFPHTELTNKALKDGKIKVGEIEGSNTKSVFLNNPVYKNRKEKDWARLYKISENNNLYWNFFWIFNKLKVLKVMAKMIILLFPPVMFLKMVKRRVWGH